MGERKVVFVLISSTEIFGLWINDFLYKNINQLSIDCRIAERQLTFTLSCFHFSFPMAKYIVQYSAVSYPIGTEENALSFWFAFMPDCITISLISLEYDRVEVSIEHESPIQGVFDECFKKIIDAISARWKIEWIETEYQQVIETQAQPSVPAKIPNKDSQHFAHPREKRQEIVNKFLKEKKGGNIANMNAWASTKYHICGRTLSNYINEFSEKK